MTSQLTVSIRNFAVNVEAMHAEFAHSLGVSVIGMLILNELYIKDGQLASDLARGIGREPTSFTPMLDNLQKAGLICRKPHPEDRRAVQIYLTPEGKSHRKAIVSHLDVIEKRLQTTLLTRIKLQPLSTDLKELFAPLPDPKPF